MPPLEVKRDPASELVTLHNEVKQFNCARLLEVTSLEELVKFKVHTLADKLSSEQQSLQTVDSIFEQELQSLMSQNTNQPSASLSMLK